MTVKEALKLENPAETVITLMRAHSSFNNHEKAAFDLNIDDLIDRLDKSHHPFLSEFELILADETLEKDLRWTAKDAIGQICGYRSSEFKKAVENFYPSLSPFSRFFAKLGDRLASTLESQNSN